MAVIRFFNREILPTRAVIWVMLFTCCWMVYMLRVNMSLNIIAMVDKNQDSDTLKRKGNIVDVESRERRQPMEEPMATQNFSVKLDELTGLGNNTVLQGYSIKNNKLLPENESVISNNKSFLFDEVTTAEGMEELLLREAERNATGNSQIDHTTDKVLPLIPAALTQPRNKSYNEEQMLGTRNETLEDNREETTKTLNVVQGENNEKGTLEWSEQEQALVLGSYFWVYPVTSLVGGPVAERWGARSVIFWAMLVSGLFTAIGPPAAKLHYSAVVVTRVVLGIAGGLTYPAAHTLIAHWVPPTEKGKFVAALQGGTLGTVATWSLSGVLIEKFGWPAAFYVPAVLTIAWCVFWCYLVSNTPAVHSRITETEKKYIENALGNKISKTKMLPPYKKIAKSVPFMAMIILHYGNLWGLFFIMTVGPKFMASVLGFKLSSAGVMSALPYLARLILAFVFGVIGDAILARNLMSTTMIRKVFCIFSHIIPGLLLVFMVYIGKSTALAVTLITLSMGFNGAATLTNLQNHQDLAPNFAGTLYGIANFVGSTAGFFAPMLTAYFTKDENTFESWRPVFFVGASVYIVSALIFFVFGSGEVQSWNFEPEPKADDGGEGATNAAKEIPVNINPLVQTSTRI